MKAHRIPASMIAEEFRAFLLSDEYAYDQDSFRCIRKEAELLEEFPKGTRVELVQYFRDLHKSEEGISPVKRKRPPKEAIEYVERKIQEKAERGIRDQVDRGKAAMAEAGDGEVDVLWNTVFGRSE